MAKNETETLPAALFQGGGVSIGFAPRPLFDPPTRSAHDPLPMGVYIFIDGLRFGSLIPFDVARRFAAALLTETDRGTP